MMSQVSDSKLLRAFAESGDEDAFGRLVQRRIDFVYASAMRQVGGDAHRAEDITQEVFVKLAQNARQLVEHPALLGWLYTTTRCAAIDAIRSEQQRKRREEAAYAMHSNETGEDVNWEQLRPVLDEALSELNEHDREVVLARYFNHQPFVQIAEELGVSENAAQKRTDRALDKLHALLGRRGITSTTTALAGIFANHAMIAAPVGMAASVTGVALSATTAISSGMTAGFLTFMSINKISVTALAALATVVALNVTQQQANAQLRKEYRALVDQNRSSETVRTQSIPVAVSKGSDSEMAELARLRTQEENLRKKIAARGSALMNGGILRVGGRVVTRDTPPSEKLEIMYPESRSSPMRAWQTLFTLGDELAKQEGTQRPFVDAAMMALMLSLDDAAHAKAAAFLGALPENLRARFSNPEQLLAPVFDQWLWKGDRPKSYGGAGRVDAYVPSDPTRATSSWEIRYTSGRTQIDQFPFKRFDDGWRYGPLSAAQAEEMLELLDPRTGQPKSAKEIAR